MNVHVFLLVFLLIFSLARLGAHGFPHHGPVQSRAAKVRTTLHRLLKPRCPDDCPACRLTSTPSSAVVPTPAPVRPWSEVKGRRGAPKRIDTQGYACPNRACRYFGNTDAQFHALVGDGCARRGAGPFRGLAGLRLSTSHDHHLVDARS